MRKKGCLRGGGAKGGDGRGRVDAEVVLAGDLHDVLDAANVELDGP